MTTYFQGYDGGTVGATAGATANSALGSSLWRAGTGTAVYTDVNPIHGTTSVNVTNAAGSAAQSQVLDLPNVAEANVQGYIRVPSTVPAMGTVVVATLSSQNTAMNIGLSGDGYWLATSWQGEVKRVKSTSAVGDVVRVAIRAKNTAGGATGWWGVFLGESATPVLEATGPLSAVAAADSFTNAQWGIVNTSDSATQTTVMVDSIRASTDAGASGAWLSPEEGDPVAQKRYQVWVLRDATTWVNLGTGKTKSV